MRKHIENPAVLTPRPGVNEPPGSLGGSEWTPEQISPTAPPGSADLRTGRRLDSPS